MLLATEAMVTFAVAAEPATVITLVQTACQFVEPEYGVDRGFTTVKAEYCKAINTKTGAVIATTSVAI